MIKKIIVLFVLVFSVRVFSSSTGYISYPILAKKSMISTELDSNFSEGGGVGLGVRYTYKVLSQTTLDGGFVMSSGDRHTRMFVGVDQEIFPDYVDQPRLSVKGNFIIANEFGTHRNVFEVVPVVSKGFNFWGEEGFPFFSLPIGLELDTKHKTYNSAVRMEFGITGKLPIEEYKDLRALVQTTLSIKDSYSGILVGLSYPLP